MNAISANKRGSAKRSILKYRTEVAVLVIGLIAMNLIFLAGAFRAVSTISPAGAGQLGDFVGGYVGTFFALVSVVLLVVTLRNQRRSTEVLSFETKYFELLKLHRENVAELDVQGIVGRRVFVVLLREFRQALEIVKRIARKHQQRLTQRQLIHIAYYCLFFGTGRDSSRMLKRFLSEFENLFIDDLESELDKAEIKGDSQRAANLTYVPFEGHQSRLGHYYRHLYQAVRYVDQQTVEIDKYEYAKTIRAQLSTHEQALLLLNSLSPIGRNWWRNGFILDYRMVQNIPRGFFDPAEELDTSSFFPGGYFEWEEITAPASGTQAHRDAAGTSP
jgi:Putative phage abortive infection protein